MSSPVRTLGPVQTANATVNTRKRVLTDSEDTEERDSKRVKPQEEQADLSKRRDAKGKDKERKKKRKKKRKVPVVQGDSSDAETPAPVHNAKSSRLRSRSIVEAGPSTINGVHLPKVEESEARLPSAGPPRASVARTSSATPDVTVRALYSFTRKPANCHAGGTTPFARSGSSYVGQRMDIARTPEREGGGFNTYRTSTVAQLVND